MPDLGRFLIIFGAIAVVAGLFMVSGARIPLVGRLPGDIIIKKGNFTFYFPLATSIVLSLVLTLLIKLFRR